MRMIVEETMKAKPINEIVLGLGIDHVVEGSYIAIVTFTAKNKKKYFVSGATFDEVLKKVQKYKDYPEFKGMIYKIYNLKGIPISYKNTCDVKDWD